MSCEDAADGAAYARVIVARLEARVAEVIGIKAAPGVAEGLTIVEAAAAMENELATRRETFDELIVEEATRVETAVADNADATEEQKARAASVSAFVELQETVSVESVVLATPQPWPAPSRNPSGAPTVPGTDAPTPCDSVDAPLLEGARFADSGASILLEFSAFTDRAGYGGQTFACDALVEIEGTTRSCAFLGDALLEAGLDADSTAIPGSTAMLKANSGLRAYGARPCWESNAAASSVAIAAPSNPEPLTVVIQAPDTVGTCGFAIVDASTSSGSGGRAWASILWTATTENADADQAAVLAAAVEAALGKDVLSVDTETLGRLEVSVGVTFTNYLGATGSGVQTVGVRTGAIPSVSVVGGASRTLASRSLPLTIEASASATTACGDLDTVSLTYAWELTAVAPEDAAIDATSASLDPRSFALAPFSLDAGAIYSVRCVVTDSGGLSNVAAVQVVVERGDLVALVGGGSERAVTAGIAIVLDAAESYDPDVPPEEYGNVEALAFAWTCAGENCPVLADGAAVQEVDSVLEGVYDFFVEVSSDARSSIATTRIMAVAMPVPDVAILPFEARKANPSDPFVLEATVGPHVTLCDVTWSVASGELAAASLQDVASVDVSKRGEALTFSAPLVLAPSALTAGGRYVFRLDASCDDGAEGYAMIEIVVNSVPTSGIVGVEPVEGMTLTTPFRVEARLWVDEHDDLPLAYSFYSHDGVGLEAQLVANSLDNSYDNAILPAGREIVGFSLDVVAYVADSLGAAARATATAIVLPFEGDTAALSDIANSLLASALETGDSEGVTQVAVATAAAINAGERRVGDDGCPADPETGASCSGYGACAYFDAAGAEIASCSSESVLACSVACACDDGWRGDVCDVPAVEYEAELALRGSLIGSITVSSATATPSLDTFNRLATALDTVVPGDVASLAPDAVRSALGLVKNVSTGSATLGVSPSTAAALASTLSNLIGVSANASDPNTTAYRRRRLAADGVDDTYAAAVDGLSTALLVDIVAGQYPVEVTSGVIALKSARLANATGASLSASSIVPGAAASSASIGAAAADGAADVTLVEFHETNRADAVTEIQSTVIRFGVKEEGDDGHRRLDARGRRTIAGRMRRRLAKKNNNNGDPVGVFAFGKALATNYEFVLQRQLPPANVSDLANVSVVVYCNESIADAVNATCPGFNATEMRGAVCGGYDAWIANATSPRIDVDCGFELAPTCLSYAEDKGDWGVDSCFVVAETPTNTTCSCREALTSDYASSSSGNAYLNYYQEAFKVTGAKSMFKEAGPLINFFAVLGGFWAFFAIFGIYLDRRAATAKAEAAKAAKAEAAGKEAPPVTVHDHLSKLTAALPKQLQKSRKLEGGEEVTVRTKVWEWVKLLSKEHEWLASIFAYEEDAPRWLRCFLNFVDMVLILFVDGTVLWYAFPAGMCEMEDEERSCIRIKSTASFGTNSMCAWDPIFVDPCTFAELDERDAFYAELQVAILALVLTLPLVKFVEVLADTYLFVPTKRSLKCAALGGQAEAADDDEDERRAVAALRLLANLGLSTAAVDDAPAKYKIEAAAGAALVSTMARVLHRRMELVDALADASDADRSALATLLACYEKTWACNPEPRWIAASRWREAFATRTHERLVENVRAFEVFAPALLGEDPGSRYDAVYHLSFASILSPGIERSVFYATLDLDDGEDKTMVHPVTKGIVILFLLLMTGGMFFFLLFVAGAMGSAQMALWAGAVTKGIVGILFVLTPLRVYFMHRYFPSTIKARLSHVGDPFAAPRVDFRTALPVEPADLFLAEPVRISGAPPVKPPADDGRPGRRCGEREGPYRIRRDLSLATAVANRLAEDAASRAAERRVAANRRHRAAAGQTWSSEAVNAVAAFEAWAPKRRTRWALALVSVYLALPNAFLQQVVVDELSALVYTLMLILGEMGGESGSTVAAGSAADVAIFGAVSLVAFCALALVASKIKHFAGSNIPKRKRCEPAVRGDGGAGGGGEAGTAAAAVRYFIDGDGDGDGALSVAESFEGSDSGSDDDFRTDLSLVDVRDMVDHLQRRPSRWSRRSKTDSTPDV